MIACMHACMFNLFSLFEDFICIDDEVFLFGGLRGFSQRFETSTWALVSAAP
jgi:hypothetical protein